MNLSIIGPPGAGNETHALALTQRFDLLLVSPGEQFRRNLTQLTELGLTAQEYMNRGELVPDDLVDAMMQDCLEQFAPDSQLALSGFPKALFQARFLDETLASIDRRLDAVIYLKADDAALTDRMARRVICVNCQQPYHLTFRPPKGDVCDVCGGEFHQRPDDLPEVIEARLRTFYRESEPIVDYYQSQGRLIVVDANQPIDEVEAAVHAAAESGRAGDFAPATRAEARELRRPDSSQTVFLQPVANARLDLALLGGPGAGKGTQAARLARNLGLIHISTGDLFLEHLEKETALGLQARDYMARGELVPDELTEAMVRERLADVPEDRGFVLDGFPRALHQAQALTQILSTLGRRLNAVFHLRAGDATLLARISGQRVCRGCHASYHTEFNPPATEGVCDDCGGAVVERPDRSEEAVRHRLRTFHLRTEPLFDYYDMWNLLTEINAEGSVDEVAQRMAAAAKALIPG